MSFRKIEHTFLWFIENYSYSWHQNGEELLSPKCTFSRLSRTAWSLRLYPKGKHTDSNKMSIFLSRNDIDGPESFNVGWKLSILVENGPDLCSELRKNNFTKKCEYGWTEIMEMDEITKTALNSTKDILIVRCKLVYSPPIFYFGSRVKKVEPICARTRIGVEHISFLHVIEDFSTLRANLKKTVQIPFHSKNSGGISNSVYRSGGSCCEEKIMLQIIPSDPNQILSKYKVSLVDFSGNIIKCTDEDNRFDGNGKEIGHFPLSLTMDALMCKKRDYLPDDKLSLLCEYSFSTGIEFQKIEGIESETTVMNTVQLRNYSHIKEKLFACPSALAELKDFYNNKYLSDVVLKTETNSFPAHKIVLCARSPVFKAMMDNDMKEKNSKSIQVDDLDDGTVQQLLLFLYSDSLENLSWETAIKLYYAADKYQIEKLKLLCSTFLIENLTLSTATELLILADTHNDCDLKKITEDFILEYEEHVFSSEIWGELLQANSQLAANTMHLKYKTKK